MLNRNLSIKGTNLEDPGEEILQELSHRKKGAVPLSGLLHLFAQESCETIRRHEPKGDSDKKRYLTRTFRQLTPLCHVFELRKLQ